MKPIRSRLVALVVLATGSSTAPAQQDLSTVVIDAHHVAGNVYMITGRGGNMGLSIGEDGAILVDDQFGELSGRIQETIAGLTPEPVRFVINTRNENMGKAGAVIVAHDNVRRAMSTEHFSAVFKHTTPASPDEALPVITFAESMTFHWNGDEIRIQHVDPAHTDGDSIVVFRDANVIHMGDTYFNGLYPYIDVGTGGSIAGMIAAADTALQMANDKTQFIPGHGPLSGVAELRASRAMLQTVHDRIGTLIKQGKSREEVIAATPTRDFDDKWGKGFLDPPTWVGIVYDSMLDD